MLFGLRNEKYYEITTFYALMHSDILSQQLCGRWWYFQSWNGMGYFVRGGIYWADYFYNR